MLNEIKEAGSTKSTFFELLGGEAAAHENIRLLVETFYEVMASDPKAENIRRLHPADLSDTRHKLTLFLTGWTGGPQRYIERYGHPMLWKRHMPFAIGEVERDEWMYCMLTAMHRLKMDDNLIKPLAVQLYGVADFMRNQ